MKKRKIAPKIAYIRWFDASYQRGELTEDEIEPRVELESAGLLIRKDRNTVSIAIDHYRDDGSWRHIANIPRVNITELLIFEATQKDATPKKPKQTNDTDHQTGFIYPAPSPGCQVDALGCPVDPEPEQPPKTSPSSRIYEYGEQKPKRILKDGDTT